MTRSFIAAVLLVLPSAGCGGRLNEQIDLVGTLPLPALSESVRETTVGDEPSLANGFDRRGWPVVTVQVPTRQVAHYPTYTGNFRWNRDRGPWNPAYPTAVDAFDDPTEPGPDVADAVTEPFVAGARLVWAPIDMIFLHQPWTRQTSPREPYMAAPAPHEMTVWSWFE